MTTCRYRKIKTQFQNGNNAELGENEGLKEAHCPIASKSALSSVMLLGKVFQQRKTPLKMVGI